MKPSIDESFSLKELGKAFWFFLEGHKKPFLFWTSVITACSFYQLVPPLIIGAVINFFTEYTPGEDITFFYLCVFGLGISFGIVSFIRLTSRNKIGNIQAEITYNVKVMGFERLLDYSLTWHDEENTGNKIQRIQNGSQSMNRFVRLMGQTGIKTITAIVGIFIVFLFLNPLFVFFIIVYLVSYHTIHSHFYKKTLDITNKYNKAQEQASGTYYEGLTNVLTIKTLGVKDSFKENIHAGELLTKEFSYKMRKVGINKWKSFQLCNAIAMTVFLLLVGRGVVGGVISIGSIFVLYTYLMRLIEAATDSTDIIDEVIEYKSSIGRMMPIYWENDAHVVSEGKQAFPTQWKKLSITDGTFTYTSENESFSIHDLNFSVRKNEKIGIVGHSGGGKSTLAKLLLGLYELESGSFTIGETDFYTLKHSEVTRHITIVLQESEMFNLSLLENITLLRETSPETLERAVRIAQLGDLIEKLPEGLDTLIGEKGYRVSGGERQRIGIARAICKDSQILVLDEATSSLDSRTEQKIQAGLEKELEQKTMIIIAHRVSTLQNVDRIVVFDRGTIVEEGTYHSLMKDHTSTFYKVYQTQGKAGSQR